MYNSQNAKNERKNAGAKIIYLLLKKYSSYKKFTNPEMRNMGTVFSIPRNIVFNMHFICENKIEDTMCLEFKFIDCVFFSMYSENILFTFIYETY